jgi:hypothetical protein
MKLSGVVTLRVSAAFLSICDNHPQTETDTWKYLPVYNENETN